MIILFEELRGKNAIVTGGSRGIGKSIVKTLASNGVNVAFTYVSEPVDMDSYIQDLGQDCGKISQYRMDVCDIVSVRDGLGQIEKCFDEIHFLVNNAGIIKDRYMMVMGKNEWESVISTNLSGTFLVSKEVLPSMIGLKKGSIVNISSVAGLVGIPGQTNYCASKAGIIGMTKALALEVAKKNIRVNVVAPGYVDTEMLESLSVESRKTLKDTIPLRRIADSKEISSVVMFLLSDGASYITGTTIQVDGGMVG